MCLVRGKYIYVCLVGGKWSSNWISICIYIYIYWVPINWYDVVTSFLANSTASNRKLCFLWLKSLLHPHVIVAQKAPCHILAPKLTSRACALRVCSPPAAIAVTQAISQTLICKALRIDSPPHAQMNKQRHKTWSFCLKYHILSKLNKIQRQVGGIFHLWQFLLDQIAHGR